MLADYVLAPKLPLETPGSTLSTEDLFTVSPALGYSEPYGQYAPPIVAPPEGSDLREDWEFFYGLAQRMGLELELAGRGLPDSRRQDAAHEARHARKPELGRGARARDEGLA